MTFTKEKGYSKRLDAIVCRADNGFVIYTRQEWETEGMADLEAEPDGSILFHGRRTDDCLTRREMANAR